jgi:hypothetical protein
VELLGSKISASGKVSSSLGGVDGSCLLRTGRTSRSGSFPSRICSSLRCRGVLKKEVNDF